jgi:hypothetical protein
MSHLPVNHHLRPVYRVAAALAGIWLLVFGAVGWSRTLDTDWFAQGEWSALGLPTNRAFAVASMLAGSVVLVAAFVGRNVDRFVNLWGGVGFILAGTLMMTVTHSEANLFNSSIMTASVSYVIGLVLLAAGLYGKIGTPAQAAAEDAYRTGTR